METRLADWTAPGCARRPWFVRVLRHPGAVSYRPLSLRGKTGTSFDALHEDVPAWLVEPLRGWVRPFARYHDNRGTLRYETDWMRKLEVRMHLEPALIGWPYADAAADDLIRRVGSSVGIDIIDYTLRFLHETRFKHRATEVADEMASTLTDANSVWEVSSAGSDGDSMLTRRALGPVRAAIENVRSDSERAGDHLMEAWRYYAGRDAIPDQAYFQAILAVETAMKPVVSPKDGDATLGKMLNAVKDGPHKCTFALGEPYPALAPARQMWETHRRHGTDDRDAPTGMSQDEAGAAVLLALTLVGWFASGAFKVA